MAIIPFIPFFALKDFGQMLIFSGAYATLYLVAVRRWPQLLVFVGSVFLVISILVVGALPRDVQEKFPCFPPWLDRSSMLCRRAFSSGSICGWTDSIRRRLKSPGGRRTLTKHSTKTRA